MAETNAPAPQTPAPQTPAPAPKVKTAADSARSIFKEFKDFISRGNVLDMAVGIIVGGAFTSIVSSLVDDLLMPLIGTVLAGINFKSLGVTIPWGNQPYLNFGSFIQQIIVFLLTAACVFVLVKTVKDYPQAEGCTAGTAEAHQGSGASDGNPGSAQGTGRKISILLLSGTSADTVQRAFFAAPFLYISGHFPAVPGEFRHPSGQDYPK